MKIEQYVKKNWLSLLLIGALVYLFASPTGMQVLGTVFPGGFLTPTQGVEFTFDSLKYSGTNFPSGWYNSSSYPANSNPSSTDFGYSMNFDPDDSQTYMPKLSGSQQPMTVDTDTAPITYSWQIKNGSTTFSNGTIADEFLQFNMYRYKCTWSMNLWLSGTEAEAEGDYRTWVYLMHTPAFINNYAGTTLWLKATPRTFVYFDQNPDQLFIAPGYLGLSENAIWAGTDKDGQITLNDADISKLESIFPGAQGETPGFYFQRQGGELVTDQTWLQYQNFKLDPSVFRKEYWVRVNLNQLCPWNGWPNLLMGHDWKFPSVQLKFTAYVFVVGQWKVYIKTGEVPALQPHPPQAGFSGGWFDWFDSPYNQLWVFFVVIVVVVLAVSILNPGLWNMVALRRRRDA